RSGWPSLSMRSAATSWAGGSPATHRVELGLDALEMAIWSRRTDQLEGLVHHSDRGVRYLGIRYTERLAEAGAVGSVGSRGNSYDKRSGRDHGRALQDRAHPQSRSQPLPGVS